MKIKIFGILICMLMIIPIFSIGVVAEMSADFKITGGYGLDIEMENTGDEPLKGWVPFQMSWRFITMNWGSLGMAEPLQPGETLDWDRRITPWFPLKTLPPICKCTINIKIYEGGIDSTIYAEKSVDALYLFGFVIILSE